MAEQANEKTSWGCLGMIAAVIIISVIYISNAAKQNRAEDAARRQQIEEHPNEYRKKCPWCGGVGRVGYMGDSKEQIERTGNGLGNPCTTCSGTGYVDK